MTDLGGSPDTPEMAADTLQGRAFARVGAEPARVESSVAGEPAPGEPSVAAVPTIAEVFEAHGDYVYRCLRGLGVRDDFLDDAQQDVFLVVQDKLGAFDGRAKLRTWLYAIVLRVARRFRERAAIEARRYSATEPESGARLELDVEHGEKLELARRVLGALDDAKREVFVLAVIEQMSAKEIADVLSVPMNTVYSRLRAARAEFAEQVTRLQRGKHRRSP
jgi:RNA polymerase sigma-70 factor (ECF subfamily)